MLGAIADDFTGATDLANNLVSRGYRTRVLSGMPDDLHALYDGAGHPYDAVVVALKTRSAPATLAVEDSITALNALRRAGATSFYDKYCSTFDSTPSGNIGPIAEALMTALGVDRTIVVPAFPDTGRTVYRGHLFVGDELLSESSMSSHPLTPMTDSNLVRILQAQTDRPVHLVGLDVIRSGAAAVHRAVQADPGMHILDAVDADDLAIIGEVATGMPLVTGSSGIALGMRGPLHESEARRITAFRGRRVVLAGSASSTTRRQVEDAKLKMPFRRIDLDALADDADGCIDEIVSWVTEEWQADPNSPVLVYSAGLGDPVRAGDLVAAEHIEQALGSIAVRLVAAGCRGLIVAGGETSGAVVQALGLRSLSIGPAIAPGVVWSAAHTNREGINIALKSGNFGAVDMFSRAWGLL